VYVFCLFYFNVTYILLLIYYKKIIKYKNRFYNKYNLTYYTKYLL